MRRVHLAPILLMLGVAGGLMGADIISAPKEAPGAATKTAASAPSPPSAAEFPVHSADIDDEQVLAAIRKGVDYLLAQRRGDNFELAGAGYAAGGASNKGGETSIIVYALLHVAESVNDDDIRKKINFNSPELAPVITYLKDLQPDGTYTAGLLASALTLLPKTTELTQALERPLGAKSYLVRATNDNGGYEYSVPGAAADLKVSDQEKLIADLRAKLSAPGKKDAAEVKSVNDQIKQALADLVKDRTAATSAKANARRTWNPDGSNTQYGVLGAWALADYGVPMPPGYWLSQDNYWRRIETPEGAFPYHVKDPKSTYDTMAAAGLATLFITQEFLDTEPKLTPRNDKQMESALAYIAETFNGKSTNQYYHYGVERVGLASGLKFFGEHDWYRELAETLVKTQNPDGSWAPGGFYHAKADGTTIATSYALLTLARGRNPVFVNKLSYPGPWNARARDAARLTEKMSKAFERPFNWQVVSHLIAPENWTDAPILLITGSEDPKFTPELLAKIKAYTEMGGIVFSSADGDKPEFTDAMKKYAAQLFPNWKMRDLPSNHSILNGELWSKVANPPKLLAVSNGVREIWIHSPIDMGASWHKRDYDAKANWDVPGNLYFYATGKTNLKSRLQSTVVRAPDTVPGPTLTVGRLMVGDNPDPEPGAWPRMARLMRAVCQTDTQVKPVTMQDVSNSNCPPALVLTGTTAFSLTDAELATLRDYLAKGGTLIADSAGMSPEFTASFKALAAKLYPKNPLVPLPANSPIYLGNYPNAKPILAVRYRSYYSLKHDIPTTPHLLGVQANPKASPEKEAGRYLILFSPEDLSSGLLGTNTWAINGYTPESAQALARNILLYTMNHAPAASTQPSTQPAATQAAASQPAAKKINH